MLPRLKSDIVDLLFACATETLDKVNVEWKDEVALTVVLASKGYPGDYSASKGSVINGLAAANAVPDVVVFHAGTKRGPNGDILANGGRVLCVTATAPTVAAAQKRAYEAVDKIDWPQGFCRRDIGWRALA
jgi:phosphoribosylamine--glycine ligase